METTGIMGKIHVSQETADALIVAGKSSWLITREEKIVAKGKGSMQTYYINPPANRANSYAGSIDQYNISTEPFDTA
jgi:Adenylate and Guanylate cyclase catalytic domain